MSNEHHAGKPVDEEGHVFLSSKGNSVVIPRANQSSFLDETELVTWLQYPLDDDACADFLQQWPPPSSASSSAAFPAYLTGSNLKDMTQKTVESSMTNFTPEKPFQVSDDIKTHSTDGPSINVSKQHSHQDDNQNVESGGRGKAIRGDSSSFKCNEYEAASTDPLSSQVVAHLDARENADHLGQCANFSHPDLFLQGESVGWGKRKAFLPPSLCSQLNNPFSDKNLTTPGYFPPTQTEGGLSSCTPYKESSKADLVADAALALGANRAATALKSLAGTEVFGRVRKSSQPPSPFRTRSCMSSTLAPFSSSGKGATGSVSSTSLLSRATAPDLRGAAINQPSFICKSQCATGPLSAGPSTIVPDIAPQELSPVDVLLKEASRNNLNRSEQSPLQSSLSALGTSQYAMQTTELGNISSITSNRSIAFQSLHDADKQKVICSSPELYVEKQDDDDALLEDSDNSESVRETLSGSKRKLEDSECQSEDAEGESAVNSQTKASSKRTRANEVHNLSERRRRNRINDKMNALRELIPNASKTNKAALLDEAIKYLKNLQLQLQVMSVRTGMSLSQVIVPQGLPNLQVPQMNPLYPVGMGSLEGSSTGSMSAGSALGVAMCNMTYGFPARPLGSLTNMESRMLHQSDKGFDQLQCSQKKHESMQLRYPVSYPQPSVQSMLPVNTDVCNSYLQTQHISQQQQSIQPQLYREQQPSPQLHTLHPPGSQQQSQYQQ
ncbi:hypothetical protein KP509_03G073600 [Ceratopteris richardii]|uniref:BHLH domain-containing protein n=1 Tax=Ceratopteris richardii TaxID=49495 RepID=A0A8T2V842_CERRI|nr:hypothetical protein KP509_03G073600 [Ceratopteris richardii]